MPSISPTRVASSAPGGGDVSPRRAPAPTPVAKMAATPPLVFDDTDLSSRRYTTEFDLVYQPGGGQGVSAMSTAATKNAPNNTAPPPRWASVNKDVKGEATSARAGQSSGNITLQERRAPSREAKPRIQVPSPTRLGENGELEGTYPPVRAVVAEHVLRPRTAGNSRPRARRNQEGGPRSRDESPTVGEGFRSSALADLPPVGKQSPGVRKATPQGRHSLGGQEDNPQFEVGGDFRPSRQASGKRDSVVLSRSGSRSRVADVLRRSGVDSEGVLAVEDDEEDDCPEGSPRVKRPNYSPPEDDGKRGGATDGNRRRSPSSILHNFSPTLDKPAPKHSSPSPPAAVARKEVEVAANKDDDESQKNSDAVKPSPAAPAATGPQHHTKIEIGMMIRRWVVTSRIGAGSFGETFCAAEVPESFELELYERLVEEATKRHHLTSTQTGGGLTTLGGSDSDLDDSVGGGGEASASINLGRPKATAVSVRAGPVASDDGDGLGPNCSAVSHDIDGSSQFDRPLLPLHDQAKAAISLEALAAMPSDMRPTSEVCIKVEQDSKNVLRLEVVSLKKSQPCPNVVKYVGSGHIDAPLSVNYLVMERLGPNLAELRRQCPHQLFDIYTTLYTGISCLESLRGVHELGLVHRDVKPSNFVVGLGPERSRICYLIDFGLARRFKRSNGGMRPPRDNAGFRGTNRYASIQSHLHQELGRVDDLWSLLFMLVEFATGSLPWRKYKEKEAIGECKQQTVNADLVRTLPREFLPFLEHLQTLSYEGEPDYDYLIGLLKTSIVRRGYASDRLLDWEKYAGESLQLDDVADRTLPLPLRIQPLTTLPVNNGQNSKPGTDAATKGGKGDDGSDAVAPPPVEPIKKKNPHSWAARARSEAEENVGGADTPRPREHPLTGASTSAPVSLAVNRSVSSPALPPTTTQQPAMEVQPPAVSDTSPMKKEDELKGSLCGVSPGCMLNVPGDGGTQGKNGEEQLGSEGRDTPTRPGAAVPPMSAEESSFKKGASSPARDNPLQQPLSNTTSEANFNIDDSSPNRTPTATLGGANSVPPSNFAASIEKEEDRGSKASDEPPVVGPNNRNRRNKKGEDDTVQGGCCDKGCTVQ